MTPARDVVFFSDGVPDAMGLVPAVRDHRAAVHPLQTGPVHPVVGAPAPRGLPQPLR